jgi:hypothetical protein
MGKNLINEETFRFDSLDQNKQEKIFDIFKSSYESSVGTSWTKEKFYSRAQNWLFFGDDNGFVTVRPQQSGMYKLTGVAGNPKSILNGLNELQTIDVPIWGMVSKDIQTMANKKGLKTPPAFLVKILIKFIPSSALGGVDFDVNSDGSLTLKYQDVGDAKKYFVANDQYFKKIKKDLLPQIKDKLSDLPLLARKSIEMFLNESKQETELKEEITSGSVIVYHRTGRNGSPVEGIAADGYRVGERAIHGIGVYTTYDLNSQLNLGMINMYGNIIIESKVISMKDFLIFDYDMAKRIYGNKNYTLERQLRLILGKDFNLLNEKDFETLNIELTTFKYTGDVAYKFYMKHKNIIPKLRGIVFTGDSDGKVLISYDRKNVEPLRYTLDEGKTWKNIINKNIYQRLKGYNDDSNNLKDVHLLNKIDTKSGLTNDEVNYIIGNERLLSTILDSDNIINLVRHSDERDKIINFILNDEKLLSKLNNYGIEYIIKMSNEPEKVFNLLGNKGVDYLSNLDISNIIRNSTEPEKFINLFGTIGKEYISNLSDFDILNLIRNSPEPEKLINSLGNRGKEYISNLNKFNLRRILDDSVKPDKVKEDLSKLRPDLFDNNIQENIKRIKRLL